MTFTLVALILAAEPVLAPPLVTADGAVQRRPARLEYRGTVPEGYYLVETPRWGLVTPGIGTFAAAYVLWASVGLLAGKPESLVPFAGPALTCSGGCGGNGIIMTAVVVDIAVQVAGMSMIVLGLLLPKRSLQRDTTAPDFSFVPAAGGNVGASVVGRF